MWTKGIFKLTSLKTLLQKGISEPEFYGDLVFRFKKKLWENLTFRSNSEN